MSFIAVALLGLVVLDAIAVAFGELLVHVLLPFHGLGGQDERVNAWLAAHRDSALNTASYVGSMIGDVPVLPVLVTIAVVILAFKRHWRVAAFILCGILIEVVTYRVASLIVHRHRPDVVRLDHLPVNQSFPSGHVAASVVVYLSLALVVTAYLRSRWLDRGGLGARDRPADRRCHLADVPGHAPPDRRGIRRTDRSRVHRDRAASRPG